MHRRRYEKYESKDGVLRHEPSNMNLKDLKEVYDYKWNQMDNRYNSTKNNCKAYARDVYNYIVKKYPK